MELQTLTITTRERSGKGAARKSRGAGRVPATLYGGAVEPLAIELDRRAFEQVIHGKGGEHAVVRLEVTDKPEMSSPALLKSVQHHPVNGVVLHADFMRIRLDQRIETQVAIQLTGRAKGIVDGGVLEHNLRELEIECPALEVPEVIAVDVSHLEVGMSIHVSDIAAPEGVTILTEPERVVAGVLVPRLMKTEAAEAAEGAEAAEAAAEGASATPAKES